MNNKHTEGLWRWEVNIQSKSISLVGGKPTFDKQVMDFGRWGMSGATPLFNSHCNTDYNIMERPCDFKEWVQPFPKRKHHADWCASLNHPEARLIAAAPVML
jgi:hypothetical protein